MFPGQNWPRWTIFASAVSALRAPPPIFPPCLLKRPPLPRGHPRCRDGSARQDDWLEKVCPAIQQRIERYAASEIRFNLMAVIKRRSDVLQAQMSAAAERERRIQQRLAGGGGPTAGGEDDLPTDEASLRTLQQQVSQETYRIQEELQREEEKFSRWRDENIRRKHNYIPFLFNLLKMLAERRQLQPLVDKAREKLS
mmetsp:Transcript_17212/g.41063  ORF Transcript_17212/g.41063 Transcript_17212/m.41063 type:complete len:197 (+) Transcript_17212:768-1358(+)